MKVLLFENNLIWSSKLKTTLNVAGNIEYLIFSSVPNEIPAADFAILNLSTEMFAEENFISRLKKANLYVIAHAGHKEKNLLEKGQQNNCDLVVSNSTISYKLVEILKNLYPNIRCNNR